MPQVRKTIQIVDKGKVRFIQINHGVTLGLAANVGTLVKVTKEKASQRPCPCGVPCATRIARGRAQTRYAQTSARPGPVAAALLSTANGLGSPRVLVRCAHIAHACSHAARDARAAAAAAPAQYALTTTDSFTTGGAQTRTATSRTNIPIRRKKTKLAVQAPLHPPRG